jgi:serine/threonine protein kinase
VENCPQWSGWDLDDSKLVREERIASGDFARVYRGRYGTQVVAVKEFRNQTLSEENRALILREVAALSALMHPNIVMCVGACLTHEQNLTMVMEYVGNGTVEDWLRLTGDHSTPLSLHVRLQIALDVASGMR